MSTPHCFGLRHVALATALLAPLAMPQAARAALGEPEPSAAADAEHFAGAIKSAQRAHYRVHEITLPSGTTLREYSEAGGSIFAVAWSGPAMPDLTQTLGRYFDTYVAAAKASHSGRHVLRVQQDEFVMQSSGHMRAFTGRAYLPKALPAGVAAEELR